jgi:hypothetical protein
MVQECGRFVPLVSPREGCKIDEVEVRQGNGLVGQEFLEKPNMAPLLLRGRGPDQPETLLPCQFQIMAVRGDGTGRMDGGQGRLHSWPDAPPDRPRAVVRRVGRGTGLEP